MRDYETELPEGWSVKDREEYIFWALKLVEKIRDTNKRLERNADLVFRRRKWTS